MRPFTTCLLFAVWFTLDGFASAESVQGIYLEARSTCSSFPDATARPGDTPRQAVLAWQIRQGDYQGVDLAGRTMVAVVTADDSTCGAQPQTRLLVDDRATEPQREALVSLARSLAPEALAHCGPAVPTKMDVRIGEGCARGCAVVDCGLVKVRTRRLENADRHASADIAPMSQVFSSDPAFTVSYASGGERSIDVRDLASAVTGSFSR